MDCEAYRRRVLEDPSADDAALAAHAGQCAGCAAFTRRVRSAERRIEVALKLDVGAIAARRASIEHDAAPRRGAIRLAVAGLAAALVAGVALYAVLDSRSTATADELAAAVAAHWDHEPAAWLPTRRPVTADALREALADHARMDVDDLGPITYARSCYLLGSWMPHLSVRGRDGPVMVVLLPNHRLAEPVPLEIAEHRLGGRIVPAGAGSIAILGADTEPLRMLERELVAAVDWRTDL